jgi:hypothetical protein
VCEGRDAISNEIYCSRSFVFSAGFDFFFERKGQGRHRLRLCVFEDEILRLHDRSQDGRAVRLWNRGRATTEGSAI